METGVPNQRLLTALDELDAALANNVARSREIQKRLRRQRRAVAQGAKLGPLVENEPEARTVEMITQNIDVLQSIGAQLRIAQAEQLRAEGLTLEEIAELFGVTRQRISALLKQPTATTSFDS